MFTPEQEAFLNERLDGVAKQLVDGMNNAVSGLAKRLTSNELPRLIEEKFSPIEQRLQEVDRRLQGFNQADFATEVRNQFDALLEELAKEEETPERGAGESDAIARLKQDMEGQMSALRQQSEQARKIAEQERATREKLVEEQRLQGLDNRLLDAMRPLVIAGRERELLTLMKQRGMLKENKEQGRFEVELPDELGLMTPKAADEAIAQIVEANYPHYLERRPGTGTGATPPTNNTSYAPTNGAMKYAKVQNGMVTLTDDQIEAAAKAGKLDDLVNELASAS